jgi:hypothetical protein
MREINYPHEPRCYVLFGTRGRGSMGTEAEVPTKNHAGSVVSGRPGKWQARPRASCIWSAPRPSSIAGERRATVNGAIRNAPIDRKAAPACSGPMPRGLCGESFRRSGKPFCMGTAPLRRPHSVGRLQTRRAQTRTPARHGEQSHRRKLERAPRGHPGVTSRVGGVFCPGCQ